MPKNKHLNSRKLSLSRKTFKEHISRKNKRKTPQTKKRASVKDINKTNFKKQNNKENIRIFRCHSVCHSLINSLD